MAARVVVVSDGGGGEGVGPPRFLLCDARGGAQIQSPMRPRKFGAEFITIWKGCAGFLRMGYVTPLGGRIERTKFR